MTKEITTVEQVESLTAIDIFKPETVDMIINIIRNEATAEVPDMSNSKGRDRVKSLAYKVSQTKTHLDGLGKDFVADVKAKAKEIDGMRKKIRDTLDEIRDEVRKPVTDWEDAEQARIDAIQEKCNRIKALILPVDFTGQAIICL